MDTAIQESEKRDLTLKQRKWIKLYLELGNATEAAMQSYDLDPSDPEARNKAGVIGYENIRKLNYIDFLEAAGVTDNLLQKKIMEGLDATKVVSAVKTSKDATADSTDFIDVPDYVARHKYLETVLKLKRRLVERQEITGENGQPITITAARGFIPPNTPITSSSIDGDAGEPPKI